MIFLNGKNINNDFAVIKGLQEFYGIGQSSAEEICWKAKIHKKCKMGELSEEQLQIIVNYLINIELPQINIKEVKLNKKNSKENRNSKIRKEKKNDKIK